MKKRVAILISGRGSNMSALIAAAKAPDYPAEIVGIFSNNPDAAGLAVAAADGIATAALSHKAYPDKPSFEAAMNAALDGWQPDIICLAGFMRLLSADFCNRWAGKLINIHPSLLPLHKGLHTHEQALAAGVTSQRWTPADPRPAATRSQLRSGPVIGIPRSGPIGGPEPPACSASGPGPYSPPDSPSPSE